jgi:hypothetical protein
MRRVAAILAILLAHGCDRVVNLTPLPFTDAGPIDTTHPPDAEPVATPVDAGIDAGFGPDAP